MTAKQQPAILSFNAAEAVTILMALEASMFLADTIGDKDGYDAARDLRNKLIKSITAAHAAAYATAEKTGEKAH